MTSSPINSQPFVPVPAPMSPGINSPRDSASGQATGVRRNGIIAVLIGL